MTFLLDVNVLIALIDGDHIFNRAARDWFRTEGQSRWATCPIVENGVLRIMSNRAYPGGACTPAAIGEILSEWRQAQGFQFWADDCSLLEPENVDLSKVAAGHQVTDTYLLALAVRNNGKLATFDSRLSCEAVNGGKDHLHIITPPLMSETTP